MEGKVYAGTHEIRFISVSITPGNERLPHFHGVFARGALPPNSKQRMEVTPAWRGKGNKKNANSQAKTLPEKHAAMHWAQRLKRVFGINMKKREHCGHAIKVIACIEDPQVIKKILAHLDQQAPAVKPTFTPESRAPPQKDLFGF